MDPEGSLPQSQVPTACPYQSRSEAYSLSVSHYNTFLRRGVASTSPNSQAGGPPLVCCPRLLIQYIRSYPPYWRPFLHPQPEDAPCRGDRDPLMTADVCCVTLKWLPAAQRNKRQMCKQAFVETFWAALGPKQAPAQWVTGVLPTGVKRPGHKADCCPPSSAEVMNEWSCATTPPMFHGVQRDDIFSSQFLA